MRFIFSKHNNITYIIFFFLFLQNCSLKEPNRSHGINFLENREKILITNKTNQNDVIKLMGNPHTISITDENIWVYFERTISKGKLVKLGQDVLRTNNVLELKFDKYGVLEDKKIYTKNDMKKIKYSKSETVNNVSQQSFVSKFLSSVKQKMYGNRK